MNRIIIIGNGFDLAHGLKTSYRDFIDDFWKREEEIIFRPHNAPYNNGPDTNFHYKYEGNFVKILSTTPFLSTIATSKCGYERFENLNGNREIKVENKNAFLGTISQKTHLQNWVDIEEEYYSEVIACLQEKRSGGVENLNSEFSEIKIALEKYLETILPCDFSDDGKISQHLRLATIDGKPIDNIIFLNFNYTNTIERYANNIASVINIHGKLGDPNNPIIFGYGDENGENHRIIENTNDNEYLKNIKTLAYLRTTNYKKLQAFIESNEYEIFIMGHSCGISDRTLLNQLFEHRHCKSIKVFYHKRDDGSDNHSDVLCNIYRVFNDKRTMRDLVVSKEDSVPLL
jgi:hypothetical protein